MEYRARQSAHQSIALMRTAHYVTESAPKDPKRPANGKEQAIGAREPRLVLIPCGEFEGQDGGLRPCGVAPWLV